MTHSTKARSVVEDSISIKGGIFHPSAVGWGGEGEEEEKEESQPNYKDAERKGP